MRKLLRLLSVLAGGTALPVMLFAWRIFGSQLERDRACRHGVAWTKAKIEAHRARLGRLPTRQEIRREDYRYSLLIYKSWSEDPQGLQQRGARGAQDYMLEFWRSERSIYYPVLRGLDQTRVAIAEGLDEVDAVAAR